jgi:HEAT repeat protein
LADKSERVQAHAEWALENIGDEAIPAVMEGAKRTATRFRAFRLLGRLKAQQAVPLLIEGLKDQKSEIRVIAAWALGEIGNRSAIPALQGLLADKNLEVRREAVMALGKLGAKEILKSHLAQEKNIAVRAAILLALRGM